MDKPDAFRDVRLLAVRTLRGPNYWSPFPITRLDLAVGAYEDIPSDQVPGLPEALESALPGLIEHRCSIGQRGGFLTRLRRGTYLPHIVEHLALELQSAIGHEVGYGRARGGDRDGEYTVVYEHRHATVGQLAASLALEMAQRAFAGEPVGANAAIHKLEEAAGSPDAPELERAVVCGVIGSGDREAVRRELLARGVGTEEEVVGVPPSSVLETGLPYSESRTAIVLDVHPGDVPERYSEPDAARRLASVVADAVPRGGVVVVPASEWDLQSMIRDIGRRVAVFAENGELASGDLRLAQAIAVARDGGISIESGGCGIEPVPLRPEVPVSAQLSAALAAFVIRANGYRD